MKIGYPCINNSIGCTANKTFRLANYSEDLLKQKVKENLECLKKTLEYNLENGLMFFRIGSGLVPFASHKICKFDWRKEFKKEFQKIGDFIKKNNFRISMHPDQFVLINAKDNKIVERSFAELEYHCDVLDLMGLDKTAKIQIHVGGAYGEKEKAAERFIRNYKKLPEKIKKRLCIENEERLYCLKDCLGISKKIGIPIIFDFFHHILYNEGENILESLKLVEKTWKKKDGIPMTDYSSQKKNERFGSHAESIDLKNFKKILKEINDSKVDIDIMLEIKDKEKSALNALKEVRKHFKLS
jgi:UV DNA damage endonuclease